MTTERTLRSTIASQFDDVRVHGELRDGDHNTVFAVSVDGRRVAWKVADDPQGTLATEGAVLSAVDERTPVPVPDVVATDEGQLLLEWAGGAAPDGTPGPSRERLRIVGRTLALLHRSTAEWFDGHGPLAPGEDPLAVESPADWPDRLGGFVEEWTTDLAGTRDADVGAAVREWFEDNRSVFDDCTPVLVHGEPAPEHARFEGNDLTAVIDWELAQAAPGPFDLVWAERDFLRPPFEGGLPEDVDEDRRRALYDGYESERPLPPGSARRRSFYRAAFAARSLGGVEATATYGGTVGGDLRTSLRSYVFECLDDAG